MTKKKQMTIALDWDGTVSRDVEFFTEFALLAEKFGHKVFILTKRYKTEAVELGGLAVIYCDRRPKTLVLNEFGIRVDVYIDNNPYDLFH